MKKNTPPAAVLRRIAELNEMIEAADALYIVPSGYSGSTHASITDLLPIVVSGKFVKLENRSQSIYNYLHGKSTRYNTANPHGLESLKYDLANIARNYRAALRRGY